MRSENKSASTANCPSAILNELKFWELPLDEIQVCVKCGQRLVAPVLAEYDE